jgi:peptidoglycan/LPS O-acetylase OafA/YrhL
MIRSRKMKLKSKPEIKPLTSTRGIAALLVVFLHSQNLVADLVRDRGLNPAFNPEAYTGFFSAGYLWVDFFFILSGFVLYYVHGAEFRDSVRASTYRTFMIKRVARVYPLNCCMLLLFLVAEFVKLWWSGPMQFAAFTDRNTPLAFVTNFLMIQSWPFGTGADWNVAAWSVSAEMIAYLLMPFMFLAFAAMRIRLVLAAIAAGLVGLALLMAAYPDKGLFLVDDLPWVRCLCSIVMGIGLATIYETRADARIVKALSSDACIALITAAVILSMHLRVNDLVVVALFLPLILGLAFNQGYAKSILCLKPIHWLGLVSFSIYLSHGFLLRIAVQVGNRIMGPSSSLLSLALFLGVTLAAILVCSALLYRYVEQPARRFGNRMLSRSKDGGAPAALATGGIAPPEVGR